MAAKPNTLRRQKDFDSVFKEGRFFQNDCLAVKFRSNRLEFPRFAVVVSAKTAKKAVIRNRLRRQLSEIIRTEIKSKLGNFDLVIMVKPRLIGKKYREIKEVFNELIMRAKLLKTVQVNKADFSVRQ